MDPVHFTGKEVLEMAVRIEENGFKFYTDAAGASKSKDVKETFLALAKDETQHISVFRGFGKLVPADESSGADPYNEEALLYLGALADTEVFTRPGAGAELSARVKDEAGAIAFAIDMEKDSILFYYEMLRMVRGKDRDILERLIEQEKGHLKKLTGLQKRPSAR